MAERSPGSVAVTVTVALPAATPVTVTSAPETLTVATVSSEEAAVYVSSSPSGSLKLPDTSTVTESPGATPWSAIVSTASGLWLTTATVTSNIWVAERSPGSVAVTPTIAAPGPTPTTVTIEPSTVTVATVVSSLAAVKARLSPSGSAKLVATSRVMVSPTPRS